MSHSQLEQIIHSAILAVCTVIFGTPLVLHYLYCRIFSPASLKTKDRPKAPDALKEHVGQTFSYVDVDGRRVRLHYVQKGNKGPLMVMLHGFPEFSYSWRFQLDKFSKDYRCVALNMRGYYESDKVENGGVDAFRMDALVGDVKGLLDHFKEEHCVLLSHDWGGAVAWAFAHKYPEMVSRLVVCNCPHPLVFLKQGKTLAQLKRSYYMFAFQIPSLPERWFALNDWLAIHRAFRGMARDKTNFSKEVIECFKYNCSIKGNITAMMNYYRSILRSPPKGVDSYGTKVLDMPVLIVWGEADMAIGKEMTYGTGMYVRDCRTVYLPNVSHWVQQEAPEKVNAAIESFLQTK